MNRLRLRAGSGETLVSKALAVMVVGVVVSVAPAVPALAATIRLVSTSGSDTGDCTVSPCRTIGYAITQSIAGDLISIGAGTYAEHVVIDRSLTLAGAGSASTFIDGSNSGTVVTIGSDSASIIVTISRVTIQNGYAESGGGILSVPGSGYTNALKVVGSAIAKNQAVGAGTGAAGTGGGIYNAAGSSLTLSLSSVTGNLAVGNGGGSGIGGGIDSSGTVAIDRSTLAGNQANGADGYYAGGAGGVGSGGGLYSTGPAVIKQSTISGNLSSGGQGTNACIFPYGGPGGQALGGGVESDSNLTAVNSTIASNTAQGGRGGDGIGPHCHAHGGAGGDALGGGILAGSTETLINSTIAANQAFGGQGGCGYYGCGANGKSVGGGIDLTTGAVGATNMILASNAANSGPDCSGSVASGGHNLLGNDASCSGFTGVGDLVNTDPILGPLNDNGGPTSTMALLSGSPAIDAGDDAVCAVAPVHGKDQRGVVRPQGPHCDMGAYEKQ
jgi:hypothetical protein